MSRSFSRRRGFTLVEILIVIVILGILAAVVLPQFTSASEAARANNTTSLLRTLRVQLQLYRSDHQDRPPKLSELWENMTEPTDMHGNITEDGEQGPYLRKAPLNQYTTSTTVVAPGEATANDGWIYDEEKGEIDAVGFNEETQSFTAP